MSGKLLGSVTLFVCKCRRDESPRPNTAPPLIWDIGEAKNYIKGALFMGKKLLALVAVCAMMFTMSTTALAAAPDDAAQEVQVQESVVARASNYFTGGTGTLNTMAGNPSKLDPVSSGSVPDNSSVTNVEVHVSVSRGSMPFYLVVVSPDGYQAERYVSATTTLNFDEFNGKDPYGKWFIYIYNMGSAFVDVSTATARMTVQYNY